jgi:hypothetical protein
VVAFFYLKLNTMNELMNLGADNEKTASTYLVEQINIFREMENNKTVLLHKSLLTKIEKEFEDEIGGQNILPSSYTDESNRQSKCYYLDFEQSLQLLMSESKTVRKRCVEVIKSKQKPLSQLEMISFMALQMEKQNQINQSVQVQILELESKNIIKDENFYTISGYANLKRIKVDRTAGAKLGKQAVILSRASSYPIGKAYDSKYGEINTYHIDILKLTFKN